VENIPWVKILFAGSSRQQVETEVGAAAFHLIINVSKKLFSTNLKNSKIE
jgi:hypothetical protein